MTGCPCAQSPLLYIHYTMLILLACHWVYLSAEPHVMSSQPHPLTRFPLNDSKNKNKVVLK